MIDDRDFFNKWIEFILKFFYDPEQVGVTFMESNSCSSTDGGGFVVGSEFYCFRGGGEMMKNAWLTFYGDEYENTALVDVDDFVVVDHKHTSWDSLIVEAGYNYSSVPNGRANDDHKVTTYSIFNSTDDSIQDFLLFPIEAIVNRMEEFVPMFNDCVYEFTCSGKMYLMGGSIPSADDGLNSSPEHRRHGGFLININDPDTREKFSRVLYGKGEGEAMTGDTFPVDLCHNHASMNYPTPLKEDWTKSCNPGWSEKEKKQKCYSFQETVFGTEGLKRLERIHEALDPNRLFQCQECWISWKRVLYYWNY